jgi:hypothetical protein
MFPICFDPIAISNSYPSPSSKKGNSSKDNLDLEDEESANGSEDGDDNGG